MNGIRVEVVYALPGGQDIVPLLLAPGTTARAAVQASGLAARHPEIGTGRLRVGVFGKLVAPEALLSDGDRVEIYRPLRADPGDARRARAVAAVRARRGAR